MNNRKNIFRDKAGIIVFILFLLVFGPLALVKQSRIDLQKEQLIEQNRIGLAIQEEEARQRQSEWNTWYHEQVEIIERLRIESLKPENIAKRLLEEKLRVRVIRLQQATYRSGHEAGFEWAQGKNIEDSNNCGGKSNSFIEGCQAYVHQVGYDWAENNHVTDSFGCSGQSGLFAEGCQDYVDENN